MYNWPNKRAFRVLLSQLDLYLKSNPSKLKVEKLFNQLLQEFPLFKPGLELYTSHTQLNPSQIRSLILSEPSNAKLVLHDLRDIGIITNWDEVSDLSFLTELYSNMSAGNDLIQVIHSYVSADHLAALRTSLEEIIKGSSYIVNGVTVTRTPALTAYLNNIHKALVQKRIEG